MIIDLEKFIRNRRADWDEYEQMLKFLEGRSKATFSLEQAQRFHFLYERVTADLNKISTYAAEPETRHYLETLVARGYSEMHENRGPVFFKAILHWIVTVFPATVRKHAKALAVANLLFFAGAGFGALALMLDPTSKATLMPFEHLLGDPSERVAEEEATAGEHMDGVKGSFSAYLIQNNTRVAIFTLALGTTFGVGTVVILFYNGVGLGAVAADYVMAGETEFLFGWLLPHGSVEIPAILLAGQAGLVLGYSLFAAQNRRTLRQRLAAIRNDLATLIGGVALLLVWAGIVESFFSQYHAPVLPYAVKITFGALQLISLFAYIICCGRHPQPEIAQ